MRKSPLGLPGMVLALVMSLGTVPVWAEATRLTNPTALYLEMGGRALGYGAGFDRVLSDDMSVGVSFGMTPVDNSDGTSAGRSALVVPAFLNYYLDSDGSTMFLTAGMSLVASDVKGLEAKYSGIIFPNRSVLPTIGWGFEDRGDMVGFLVRISAYAIIAQKVMPWVGFNFGYSF